MSLKEKHHHDPYANKKKMPVINYMYLMPSLIHNSGHGFKYFIKEASAADMLIIYRLCSTYPILRRSDNFVACMKV